jgi:hypothetical protein
MGIYVLRVKMTRVEIVREFREMFVPVLYNEVLYNSNIFDFMFHVILYFDIERNFHLYRLSTIIYDKGRSVFVGPCHHGMVRPQIADGGTASDMEGSCEYIE